MTRDKQVHVMANGNRILITEMGDCHLLNTIRLFTRKAQEGFDVSYYIAGEFGATDPDSWCVKFFQGDKAQEFLNLSSYVNEARKRGLLND